MKNYMKVAGIIFVAECMLVSPVVAQVVDYSSYNEIFEEPVTTSGNGSPQRKSEVAVNMEIITAEEISNAAARTIPELLRFTSSVDVRQHSFGQTEVSIRGYNQPNAERILVLVNGRQVYTDFFGQVVWDNIPVELDEIQQIEIVKGPNTALFGFNATSGVINIITKNPLYDELRSITVSGGTHGLREVSGVVIQKLNDRIGVRVSGGGYDTQNDFDRLNPAIRDKTQRASGVVDVWGQVTDNIQAQFEITQNDHVRNENNVTRINTAVEYDTRSIRGRVVMDSQWGMIDADIYHNDITGEYDLSTSAGQFPLDIENDITVAKLSNTFKWNQDHTFRLGGEYRTASNFVSIPHSTTILDQSPLTYEIWSGSALWDYRISDKLRSSVAVRYDHFDLEPEGDAFVAPGGIGALNPFSDSDYYQTLDEYSYNLGLVYEHDEVNTFRTSIARGVDLPSFVELGLQFFQPAGTSPASSNYGDPDTQSSIVHNYEIGYDRQVDAIDGSFNTAIFYQHNDEMQGFFGDVSQLPGPIDRSLLTNMGDSEMYGIELGVKGLYKDRWNWGANYTYVNVEDDLRNQQNSAPRSSSSDYENSVASHILNANIGYNADKWRAGLWGQYKSSFDDVVYLNPATTNTQFEFEEVNDQVIVNANFSYDLTDNLTWSVSGTSIIGDTQQYVSMDAEEVIWTSLRFKF